MGSFVGQSFYYDQGNNLANQAIMGQGLATNFMDPLQGAQGVSLKGYGMPVPPADTNYVETEPETVCSECLFRVQIETARHTADLLPLPPGMCIQARWCLGAPPEWDTLTGRAKFQKCIDVNKDGKCPHFKPAITIPGQDIKPEPELETTSKPVTLTSSPPVPWWKRIFS